jgi:hypothetical protein
MKQKLFIIFLLISFLGINRVEADTIYINMEEYEHGSSVQFCVDHTETFCLYYPEGTTVDYWEIYDFDKNLKFDIKNGNNQFFFVSDFGSFTVFSAKKNHITSRLDVHLYDEAPPHANFEVVNAGGVFNETNDTLWDCRPYDYTLDIRNNADFSKIYSYEWIKDDNEVVKNGNLRAYIPGWKYYIAKNACGTTIDSFYLSPPLPTEIPEIEDYYLFCNEPVDVELDVGEGWFYTNWSTGEISPNIQVTEGGTYTVELGNACIEGTVTVEVEHHEYPLPDLKTHSINVATEEGLCHGEVAILIADPEYEYDIYIWNGEEGESTLEATYDMGEYQNYELEVRVGNCVATSSTNVWYAAIPQAPTICIATFDPEIADGRNKLVFSPDDWDKDVKKFIAYYKEGADWRKFDSTSNVGQKRYELADFYTNPAEQSRTYTVLSKHKCGHLSKLTDHHKTIRIGIFQDIYENFVIQIMDGYITMDGSKPDTYDIWVDDGANFYVVATIDGANNSYTLTNPIPGALYYASANLPWNCDFGKSNQAVAFSNKSKLVITDIPKLQLPEPEVKVYPNPSSDIVNIEGKFNLLEIYDNLGRLLLSTQDAQISVNHFDKGIYFAKVHTNHGSFVSKLMIE